MNTSTEKIIKKIYDEVFKKIYSSSSLKKLSSGDKASLLKLVTILNSSKKYEAFAKKYAKILAKKGITYKKGEWKKYFKEAKKMGHIAISKTWTKFEEEQMKKVIKKNFEMIKTIPSKTLEVMERKYTGALIEEVAKGNLSRGDFYKQLKMHGHKNAKVIARTESAKLQASIVESRAEDLGSVAYMWISTKDVRTRPSHREMNGVYVLWRNKDDEKPLLDNMNGNPGEFPNCRCSAQPIFDEDDLPKSGNVKFYDYKKHKIITISVKELLKILKKNGGDVK